MIKNKLKTLRAKIVLTVVVLVTILLFIVYGPFPTVRETWVTSAMTTFSHQWLATSFFSQKTIDTILEKNRIYPIDDKIDLSLIQITDKTEKTEVIDVSTKKFRAYLMIIPDPSKVELVFTEKLGGNGLKLETFIKEKGAIGGINASGFKDASGHTKGGHPAGLVLKNREILSLDQMSSYYVVGLTEDCKLYVGEHSTLEELYNLPAKEAISFGPVLIINGQPTLINGDGGWGISPRTSIGQTADGTILMLVIDGRQISSLGATLNDVQKIMLDYGAINASNLDGGSSSIMMMDRKVVNYPCTTKTGRYLPSAFLVYE